MSFPHYFRENYDMKSLIIALFVFPVCLHAQIRIVKDTSFAIKMREWPHAKEKHVALILSDGTIITQADNLKLGKGSLPNGDYNFIATPSNTMEAKLKGTTKLKQIELYDIRVRGDKKYGYKYIVMAEHNYLIQLEDAISSGEIILGK